MTSGCPSALLLWAPVLTSWLTLCVYPSLAQNPERPLRYPSALGLAPRSPTSEFLLRTQRLQSLVVRLALGAWLHCLLAAWLGLLLFSFAEWGHPASPLQPGGLSFRGVNIIPVGAQVPPVAADSGFPVSVGLVGLISYLEAIALAACTLKALVPSPVPWSDVFSAVKLNGTC